MPSNFKFRRLLVQCLYSVDLSSTEINNDSNNNDAEGLVIYKNTDNFSNNRDIEFFKSIKSISDKTYLIQEIDPEVRYCKYELDDILITKISLIIFNIKKNDQLFNAIISEYLSENWKIDRIGVLILLILKAAIYELVLGDQFANVYENDAYKAGSSAGCGLIITDYLEIAKGFNYENEIKFINSIADKILKKKEVIISNINFH